MLYGQITKQYINPETKKEKTHRIKKIGKT